jgi:endo-beta-N-acetylglucosaminidase D
MVRLAVVTALSSAASAVVTVTAPVQAGASQDCSGYPRLESFAELDAADGSTQGGTIDNLYAFDHWQYADDAYYFRHSLVSVPPVVWTNAAHRNGVRMLGVIEADFEGYDIDGSAPGGAWGALDAYTPGWPAYGGSTGFPTRSPLDVWRPLDDRIWDGSSSLVGPDCSTNSSDGISRVVTPRAQIVSLPFTTSFNRGFGKSFSVLGNPVPSPG